MTEEQQAEAMGALSTAFFTAIQASSASNEITLLMGTLGVVAGALAKACGNPSGAMERLNLAAEGVISGELLD